MTLAHIAILAVFLASSGTAAVAQECDSKESCGKVLIEWLNVQRARLEQDPDLFLLHSQVLEPCLRKKLAEGAGRDVLEGTPLLVQLLFLEVMKRGDPNVFEVEQAVKRMKSQAARRPGSGFSQPTSWLRRRRRRTGSNRACVAGGLSAMITTEYSQTTWPGYRVKVTRARCRPGSCAGTNAEKEGPAVRARRLSRSRGAGECFRRASARARDR